MKGDQRQWGGTWVGFAGGMATGLLIALGIAVWVMKTPLPLIERPAQKPISQPAESANLPDPNPNLRAATTSSSTGNTPESTSEPMVLPPPNTVIPPESPTKSDTAGQFVIQAGAFKNVDDADQMKAKLAMLGYEARVVISDKDGQTFHRVRIGPYGDIDELNRARGRLTESGIESSVVRTR